MLVSLQPKSGLKSAVTFTRKELNAILSIYSFQVSKGAWRDYAIDFLRSMAVFSIFRHTKEQPLVSVVKIPGNTATGFIYEIFYERKSLSRTPFLDKALNDLRETL